MDRNSGQGMPNNMTFAKLADPRAPGLCVSGRIWLDKFRLVTGDHDA
jgi:hypothetical protein